MATIVGNSLAPETLRGGAENDTLIGGGGINQLYGGGGADIFKVSARLAGESMESNDTIEDFQIGTDKIDVSAFGISSWDQLKLILATKNGKDAYFNAYYNFEFGLNAHEVQIRNVAVNKLTASSFIFDTSGAKKVVGTDLMDRLFGSAAADVLDGGGGDDQLFGGAGNDTLIGGLGYNTLYGQDGADIFKAVARERVQIESRWDTIGDFQIGVDRVDVSAFGISSFDQLKLILETSKNGDAFFNAYYGLEAFQFGFHFNNIAVDKLTSADFIYDRQGAKTETGTSSNDRLFGSKGADTLNGSGGDDQLFGGVGNDILIGGGGENDLFGQGGDDTFKMQRIANDAAIDTIHDFQTGADKIDVSAWGISSFEQIKLLLETKNGTDAYFQLDFYSSVRLSGVSVGSLRATDFIFDKQGPMNLKGTDGNDWLFGSAAADKLVGGYGNDKLFGGAGDDLLYGGISGTTTLYGQAGTDTFIVNNPATGGYQFNTDIVADFQVGVDKMDVSRFGISSFDQLQLILETKGGKHAYFSVRGHNVQLSDVKISQLTASDFIFDARKPKNQSGTDGDDRLFGSALAEIISGGAGDDQLFGGAGNDTLSGGTGYNDLYGQAGADTFKVVQRIVGDPAQWIEYPSSDTIKDFQIGVDKVDLSAWGISSFDQLKLLFLTTSNGKGVYFNARYDGASHRVQLDNVSVDKLKVADFIFDKTASKSQTGTDNDDFLFGTSGADKLYGKDGDDSLFGGNGNDVLSGGLGLNMLYGGAGADIFKLAKRTPGDPENWIYQGSEDIVQDFVAGVDRIDVSAWGISSFDQIKSLLQAKDGAHAYFDAYYNGEIYRLKLSNIAAAKLTAADFIFDKTASKSETGTAAADHLFGTVGADTLNGNGGNDQLFSGNGDDKLNGGLGADKLTGGAGKDVFLFKALSDSTVASAGRDTILDFSGADGDRINLSAIDANTKIAGNQAFSLLGTGAFTGKAGELRYDKKASDTYVYGDVDGDGKADFAIHLDDGVTLSKGYFVL